MLSTASTVRESCGETWALKWETACCRCILSGLPKSKAASEVKREGVKA